MVDSSGEGRGWGWAPDGKVPFKQGGVAEGARVDVGGGVVVEFGGFADLW